MKASTPIHVEVCVVALGVAVVFFALGQAITPLLDTGARVGLKSLVLAPAVEEIFFRGIVQARLRASGGVWGRPWPAITATALCFAVAHLAFAPVAHAALVVLPALFIGWVYERTRSLVACIGLHSVANAVWIGFWSL